MIELTETQAEFLNLILSPIPFDSDYYDIRWNGVPRMDTWVEYVYGQQCDYFYRLHNILTNYEYSDDDRKMLNDVREYWIKWDTKNMWKEYMELPEE